MAVAGDREDMSRTGIFVQQSPERKDCTQVSVVIELTRFNVTRDHKHAACFVIRGLHRIFPRMPSTSNDPEELALDDPDGRHRDWIRFRN
ncbi:hypothetical protein E4U13_000925 [Claviceps humidiphila]|uniref:Uncharacterized protein n=1 Tax=Claviceps humidiphila TaxID=1294629 RepID=A0A9P7Q6G3_9HYPO|nr:hypothetical protein E4U13_000925 [Claviceps humidiphila]